MRTFPSKAVQQWLAGGVSDTLTHTIPAIPTIYQGIRFRSRLEARWAVFLNALNLTYLYEAEGWDLDGEWYLPDFYIPNLNLWLEIKPQTGADLDSIWPDNPYWNWVQKVSDYPAGDAPLDYKNLVVLVGQPIILKDEGWLLQVGYCGYVIGDLSYRWCECRVCGRLGIQFEGRAERICGHRHPNFNDSEIGDHSARLLTAYEQARRWQPER